MLTLRDQQQSRREFLRIGSLALGGLSLPGLLATRAAAARAGRLVADKSARMEFVGEGMVLTCA